MPKTIIKIITDDPYHHYKAEQFGVVDGYVTDVDNRPKAVVLIEDRIVLVELIHCKVLNNIEIRIKK